MADPHYQYIGDIYSGLRNSRFILLLGAEFSAPLGYPTKRALSEMLAMKFLPNGEELKGKSLQEVIEYLEKNGVDRKTIVDHIRQLYSEPRDKTAGNPYVMLKSLLEALESKVIIFTTNWDRAIDEAFRGTAEIIATKEQLTKLLEREELPRITVFKLHGDIGDENMKESLVLTEDDIGKSLSMREELYRKLEGILEDNRLLIIGYSGGDSDILEIYERARRNVKNKVDYMIAYALNPDEKSEIQNRFPSLNVLNEIEVCSFLDSLLNYGKVPTPQLKNRTLEVDEKIKKAVAKGSILVRGSRGCGKTYTFRRLQSDEALSGYYFVDLPYSSADEDYERLKNSVSREKLVIFVPNYYFDYYNERYKKEVGKDILKVRKFTEIDHTINEDEAEQIFFDYIENNEIKEKLKDHSIINTVLNVCKHSDRKGYSTYLPSLLHAHAAKIEKNLQDRIEQGKSASQFAILSKRYDEVIDSELEKLELEIREQDTHKAGLYAALGLETSWATEEIFLALKDGSNGIYQALNIFGLIAPAVPVLNLISLIALGSGLLLSLYEWHKEKGKKRNVLSFLVAAREHWKNMDEAQREVFAYDFERMNKLPPGSGYAALVALFDPGKAENLEKEVQKYLNDHPDLFETVIERSTAWKELQEQLNKLGTSIEDLSRKFNEHLDQIDKEINEIKNKVQKIENKINDLEKEIIELKKEIYTGGSEEIHNESELRNEFSVSIPEKSLLVGVSPTDEEVMSYVNEIINKASNNLVLITGDAGVGKSTMLFLVGTTLLKQRKKLFYITDVNNFSLTDFSKFTEDSYAIIDADRREVAEKIVERLNELTGNYHLSRIIIAVRTAYISKLKRMNNIHGYTLRYSQEVLREIAKRKIHSIVSEIPNLILTEEIDIVGKMIVEKSEGVALYISEAIKKLKFEIERVGKFYEKMLEELPKGIGSMVLKNLDEETEREKLLLIVYYLISHYPNFPEEFLSSAEELFGIPFPCYVDKVPGKQSFTLHSWYRDVTDWIIQENYDMLDFGDAHIDKDTFKKKVGKVQTSRVLLERGDNYIDSIKETLSKKEVLKSLTQQIEDFMKNLGVKVRLIDLADAMMLFLIFHASGKELKKVNTPYGFMIDRKRIDLKELDKSSYQFYNKLVGFLVNTFLNIKDLKQDEIDLKELDKSSYQFYNKEVIRPFYDLSILYISRLLAGDFAKTIDEEFLGKAEPSLSLLDIAGNYSNSPSPLKLYLSAFVSFLERVGYIKPQSEFEKGLLFYCKGMFKEAIQKYENSIELIPNNPLCHCIKGLALAELGKYGEAIEEFDKAIELDPNNLGYYNSKGNALAELGKYEEAIEEFDKAIELDPNNPDYHYNKGLALAELGEYEEAIEEFDKAIELDPNNPDYHNSKGLALAESGKYGEAIEEYDIAIERNPNYSFYHYNKGLALAKLGKYEEAIKEFDIAIELDPNYPGCHYNKGNALAELGKYEEAIEEFDKAIELDPNNPVYHNNKGAALAELGEYEEAIEEYDIAIERNPNYSFYHYNKGLALAKLGKYEEAIESALRALDRSPGNPDYLILYAELEADLASPEKGISKISGSIASGMTDRNELCAKINDELEEVLNEKEKEVLLNIKKIICQNEGNYKNG